MNIYYQSQLPLPLSSDKVCHEKVVDSHFPTQLANDLARLESFNKHLYRPNTYLHKWWARRCGSTFRIILKHLVDDFSHRGYYDPGGLDGKIILDPMMGGGTTLHEAIRLGANVIGMDIDPIPILQARASLSDIPLRDLERWFTEFYDYLASALSSYFITTCPDCGQISDIQFTLYGSKRSCSCSSAIFLNSTILRFQADGSNVSICPTCHEIVTADHASCHSRELHLLKEKTDSSCKECGDSYREDTDIPFYARYVPVVIVGQCRAHGLFFKKPSYTDLETIKSANSNRPIFPANDDFRVVGGPKSDDLIKRNVTSYLDLFSSRQLLYLHHCQEALSRIPTPIRLNLALLVSTSLEFNSMLCGYKGGDKRRPGAVRHTFSHHAYSFPVTSLENNPLFPGKISGSILNLFASRIQRGRKWALSPKERMIDTGKMVTIEGEYDIGTEVSDYNSLLSGKRRFLIQQGSATTIPLESESVDYVVTDPPYFDSVQYSDLAAFFRVWLRGFLPDEADWNYDTSESAVDPHTNNGNGKYAEILGHIFQECRRVLRKGEGRLVFTFHHWNPKGWTALSLALKRAGFLLMNRHTVHSENPTSVHISYQNALKYDAVLILGLDEIVSAQKWIPPKQIDKTDGRKFCQDCATFLGWILSSALSEDEIEYRWIDVMK